MDYRIGFSKDIHRLVENRKLIIGGVVVPFEKGELAHSDGDVLYHALAESILGALALGDLGTHFPDNSNATLDMDSKIILTKCYDMVLSRGYKLNNLDVTIYSEKIKIAPIREQMRLSIASLLGVDVDLVSIKATTYEGMSFIGQKLALACEAVCLVSND